MISDDFKCIFIHIPRCAGTSIDFFFKKMQRSFETIDCFHDTIHMIKKKYPDRFKNYFKFAFVRNTWDRILSWYLYHRDLEKISPYIDMSFKRWVKSGMPIHSTLFWKKWRKEGGGDSLDQMEYLSEEVDFIGRFKNLKRDFRKITDRIGITCLKLPHLRKAKNRHYRNYYDDETKNLVRNRFLKEIKYFCFDFEEKGNFGNRFCINQIINWIKIEK